MQGFPLQWHSPTIPSHHYSYRNLQLLKAASSRYQGIWMVVVAAQGCGLWFQGAVQGRFAGVVRNVGAVERVSVSGTQATVFSVSGRQGRKRFSLLNTREVCKTTHSQTKPSSPPQKMAFLPRQSAWSSRGFAPFRPSAPRCVWTCFSLRTCICPSGGTR